MTTYQTVVPAYGRDYRSKKAALTDWNAYRDFRCEPQGRYITKAEADASGLVIELRYNRLMQVVTIRPTGEAPR